MKPIVVCLVVTALIWSVGAPVLAQSEAKNMAKPNMAGQVLVGSLFGVVFAYPVQFAIAFGCGFNHTSHCNWVPTWIALNLGAVMGVAMATSRYRGNVALAFLGAAFVEAAAVAANDFIEKTYQKSESRDSISTALIGFTVPLTALGAAVGYDWDTTLKDNTAKTATQSLQFDMPVFEFNF